MKTGKGHNACLRWWWTESLIHIFLLIPCVLGEGQQSDSVGNIRHHWLLIAVLLLVVIGSITICWKIGPCRKKQENESLAQNVVSGNKRNYESFFSFNEARDGRQRTEHSDCRSLRDNHPQSEEGNVKPHSDQKQKSRSQSDPGTINRDARRVPNADGERYSHSHKQHYHQKRSNLKFHQEGWTQDPQWNISHEHLPAYKPPTEVDFPEPSSKKPREHALDSSVPRSKQQKNEKWNKDVSPTQSYSSRSHAPTAVPHNAYDAHGSVLLSKEVDFPEPSSKKRREHALDSSVPRSKQQKNEKWNKDVTPTQSYSIRSHASTAVPHNAYDAHGSVLLSKEVDFPEPSLKRPRKHAMDISLHLQTIKKESCTQNKAAFLQFIEKVVKLDGTARSNNPFEMDWQTTAAIDFDNDVDNSFHASNPCDIPCYIFNTFYTDYMLQQIITTKMAMLQFAIPLLLPNDKGTRWTFMLWAMRDIVKRWRPKFLTNTKGFREDNLVNIPMPFFSFIRLGECGLSKSKILNQVLSPTQQIHNFFIHRDMDGGNITKESSDGLVEISWYFPSGQEAVDVFSEPLAVTNLRGDLESHDDQFQFLLSISSAMFIFVETINEEQYKLLSVLSEKKDTQYFFIINASNVKPGEDTLKLLGKLSEDLKLKKMNVIIKNKNVNDSQVVLKLQSTMKVLLTNNTKVLNLHEIADRTKNENEIRENEKQISVDEGSFILISKEANNIIDQIKDITQFKKETMKLQGDLWRQITKAEKELSRMRELGDKDPEQYKSKLQTDIHDLRRKQSYQKMPKILEMFTDAMAKQSPTEKKLFIKWLAIHLEKTGRSNLSKLHGEYREKLEDLSNNANELKNIDQRIADSSLGIEHFLRELGQFYEAAKFMGHATEKNYSKLPKIVSDMLFNGFPLELIDGDASNIPLLWITDVLKELDIKTGGKSRIRVITVLGVQSTGKSTLLNTMFGLELPVASGRCTRGAFMTLINVDKDFQEELDCQFILVIDTEGLKSMELSSLDGSYEHDNELATVVVGLSDITIINMAMENTEEMKDILQIVVHAFLRMKEVGKKPSCQFVHQNVNDVSAHVKNQRARQKFLEQLNELTKIAAKMEKRSGIASFSDIIYCDLEQNSWYIPGLWHGIPPMASINIGYSNNIKELKKSIIKSLQSMPGKPQTILEFTEWLKSLWNAVKHEKFIFSFRNRLVTEAYNQLCMEYSDWEWRFQKNAHHWMIKTETLIYNLSSDKLEEETWNKIIDEMYRLLDKEEEIMSRSLENYFEHDYDNAHLLDMFRGDFFRSVNYLRKELGNTLITKCEKTMRIQKEKCEIQAMQERYINMIETKVAEIMDHNRRNKVHISPEQLKKEFEMMWKSILDRLRLSKLESQDIEQIIIQQLTHDMKNDEQALKKLKTITSLAAYKEGFISNEIRLSIKSNEEITLIHTLASSLLQKCKDYVFKCVNTGENFNEMLSQELLRIINKTLNRQDVNHFTIIKGFELNLKLHILGIAAPEFQKMHNDFVQKNDPRSCLEMLRPEYFSIFQSVFEKRNECQRRAEQFCELCLKPAIIDHINRHLGKEIVEEILQKGGPWEFKSHTVFQSMLLEELLQKKSCEKYTNYINGYEIFVETWIFQYILKLLKDQRPLQALQFGILQSLAEKIMQVLINLGTVQFSNVSVFLATFCNILKEDLVISQNNLKVVSFQSNVNIGKFINDIEAYLPDLLKELQMQMTSASASSVFSQLNLKPQEELAKKVMGCGKQCPFCKAPCEAGGADHKEHFASRHRPRGLAQHKDEQTGALDHTICSTNVISNRSFRNAD